MGGKTLGTCSIDGCGKPNFARKWCSKHWNRWRRHGDPLTIKTRAYTVEEKFQFFVQPTGFCWEWVGSLNPGGYGNIKIGGKTISAHRWVYETLVGPIPEGLDLDHLCRVRHCVNPDHLEPVTRAENLRRGVQGFAMRRQCTNGHDVTTEDSIVIHGGTVVVVNAHEERKEKQHETT